MTTPERIRRRQLFLSSLAVVAILLSLLSTLVVLHRVNSTQDCLSNSFADLTTALNARSDTVSRNTASVNKVILGVATADTAEEFRSILEEFAIEQKAIEADRKKNPYPPYPPGNCDKE